MIQTRIDSERGCGWRQEGGLYLISGGSWTNCARLPIPLTICPTCGEGVKFARSWTWVNGDKLIKNAPCPKVNTGACEKCAWPKNLGKCGLLWIGEKFYPTPQVWLSEANRLGVSRRIKTLPHAFKLGETEVLVAHKKAIAKLIPTKMKDGEVIENASYEFTPGIFAIFKPTAVEYVVKGDETNKELERLEKRNITPVKVYRSGMLPLDAGSTIPA